MFYGYDPTYLFTYISILPYLSKTFLNRVIGGVVEASPESLAPLVGWFNVPLGQKSSNN